jgi:lysophospholipase L1-like esterase
MRSVLCYGDSNTWGYNAATLARFPYPVRWTSVLQAELGPEYVVIPEGLNGRTTVWPDPVEGEHKNGKSYFWPCLESHYPIDLLVLMLGTNDTKHRYGLSAWDIASGAQTLIQIAQTSTFGPDGRAPQVLLIGPALVVSPKPEYAPMLEGAEAKSRELAARYREVATTLGCHYLNAADVVDPDPLDGLHFTAEGHARLGRAVADCVSRILGA